MITPEEGRKLAKQYLGDRLLYVTPPSVPAKGGWIIRFYPANTKHMCLERGGNDLETVLLGIVAKLRAAGWEPNHTQLE